MSPDQLQRQRLLQELASAAARNSGAGCRHTQDENQPETLRMRMLHSRANARAPLPDAARASKNKDPEHASLFKLIDGQLLTRSVADLAELGTRWSYSPQLPKAERWIREKFADAGYPAARIRSLPFGLPKDTSAPTVDTAANVVCFPKQADEPFLLVCAHYDSTSDEGEPDIRAPGADDNASGVAVMLEVARIARSAFPDTPVMYVAFAGEEQGLIGSCALAELANIESWPIHALINLDMVGWVDPKRPSTAIVEYDMGWSSPHNNAAAKFYGRRLARAALKYASLDVECQNIASSDYLPFEMIDVPCIGISDGGYDPEKADFYHSPRDLPAVVNEDRLVQVTQTLLAFIGDFVPY